MKSKIIYIKSFVFLLLLFFHYAIIQNIYFLVSYLQYEIGFKNIEFYSKYIDKQILKVKKIDKPKISIISPVYNREKFLFRFLKSIQHQNFKDIEIIFVDDNSSDDSAKLIKEFINKDKRISLIKNSKNRGTFISRNIGALYSKGKYLIMPDPDDIISNNILSTCYNLAERYKFDFIRFNVYLGKGKLSYNYFSKNHENKPIYQPELSTHVYYGNKEIGIIDCYMTNKFIKKTTYLKALNYLNNFYFHIYMTFMEDSLMNFIIYRVAKSYYFTRIIGYRYFKNSASITNKLYLISELRLKFAFYYVKCIFEYSKNTKYEKDMANLLFSNLEKDFDIGRLLSSAIFNKDEFIFYDNICNIFLNSTFISDDNKLIFQNLKKIIDKKNQSYIISLRNNKTLSNMTNHKNLKR